MTRATSAHASLKKKLALLQERYIPRTGARTHLTENSALPFHRWRSGTIHRCASGDEHIRLNAQTGAAVLLGLHEEEPRCGVGPVLYESQPLRFETVRPQHRQHLGQPLGPVAERKPAAVLQQTEAAGADVLEGAVRLVAGRGPACLGALGSGGKIGRIAGADVELPLSLPERAQVGEVRRDVADALLCDGLLQERTGLGLQLDGGAGAAMPPVVPLEADDAAARTQVGRRLAALWLTEAGQQKRI